jgi:hypothetical protein
MVEAAIRIIAEFTGIFHNADAPDNLSEHS